MKFWILITAVALAACAKQKDNDQPQAISVKIIREGGGVVREIKNKKEMHINDIVTLPDDKKTTASLSGESECVEDNQILRHMVVNAGPGGRIAVASLLPLDVARVNLLTCSFIFHVTSDGIETLYPLKNAVVDISSYTHPSTMKPIKFGGFPH